MWPPSHAGCRGPAVSYCLGKPILDPPRRVLAVEIHVFEGEEGEKKNKLSSVVNFSSAVGVITNNQGRMVTVLKVTVT